MPSKPETLIDDLLSGPGTAPVVFMDHAEREETLTSDALRSGVLRAAGALAAAGVRAGDRVPVIMPTGPAFLYAFYGCQALGALPVPIASPARLGRLDEYHARTGAMMAAVKASVVVTDDASRRLLEPALALYNPPLGVLSTESLLKAEPVQPREAHPDDIAFVQFSSGSTVSPKPVAVTHRQLLANIKAIGETCYTADHADVHLAWLPLYHDMGLIGCCLNPIYHRVKLVLFSPDAFVFRPALWLRALSRHHATVTVAPNFAFALSVKRVQDEELAGVDLSSCRIIMNGAEPISAQVCRAFNQRFKRWGLAETALAPVYGLAEATLCVTATPYKTRPFASQRVDRSALGKGRMVPGEGPELVSVGTPLRDIQVQVRGPDKQVLTEGEVGRIWARSPSLMKGYLDIAETPIVDGWLDTGDLGVHFGGELYITGRAKDVIIIRGQNHLPQEAEEAAARVEGIRPGAVAAVGSTGDEGEELLIFAECKDPRPELRSDCRRAVLAAMGVEPSRVILLEQGSLPKTTSGKIRRGEMLRRWNAGEITELQ
jgi:fatty-acyl-CoA synthase